MKNSIRFIRITVMAVMLASNAAYAKSNSSLSSAEAKLASGRNKDAIADFTRAIEHNPNHSKSDLAQAYNHRGLAEQAIGDVETANSDFRKAIELDPTPKDAIAYTNRGIAKSAIGDLDGATSDFKMAFSLSDNASDESINLNNG
jgi:tetratricopeptide (TPR) repeat protein